MPQESLLPGTHAIVKGQVENIPYRGGRLVRYKNLSGYVTQQRFVSADEAHIFFLRCVDVLKVELVERRDNKFVWEDSPLLTSART